MTALEPPDTVPVATEKATRLKPGFLAGVRGIWLFTWRSQLTLRRLPVQLFTLLVLPALILLTTSSQRGWSERHTLLGNPSMEVNRFIQRLGRSQLRLTPEQTSQLYKIFGEEFVRAERDAGGMESGETSADAQTDLIKACYERIENRVQPVLDEEQLTQFKAFEKRSLLQGKNATQPFWNRTAPFYHWLIDFYFFVIMPLICVSACGSLIREELQADTLGFLITRPLTRARLLVIKYLCQTTWLQCIVLIEAVLLFTVGSFRQIPGIWGLLLLFLPVQCLAVFAWSALGAFLGLITKRFMALALVYGLIVEMGIGRIPTNINTLSLIRNLKTLLSRNPGLQAVYQWPREGIAGSLGAIVIATGLFVTLAALMFTFKEYHHTAEMQK